MRIEDLVRPDCIKIPLQAKTRADVIDELVNVLVGRHDIESADDFIDKIKARETVAPTDYLPNMAFPHETSHAARKKCIAIGKLESPIKWGGLSGQEVSIIFLFVVPEFEAVGRIQILKALTETLHGETIHRRLMAAKSSAEIYNIVTSIGTDFDTPHGFRLRKIVRSGHSDVIHTLAWSTDGRRIASGGAGTDHCRVSDSTSGKLIQLLEGHTGPVYSAAWSPDGQLLATASSDNLVRFWDANDLRLKRSVDTQAEVYGLAWSPDSHTLASAGHTFMVRLWDAANASPLPGIHGGLNIGYSVVWSPDGRWLAAGGGRLDPSVRVWNAANGQLATHLVVTGGSVFALAWSPRNDFFAAGSADGSIQVNRVETWKQETVLQGHIGQSTGIDFSFDGEFLASKADDGTVRVWHVGSWEELAQLPESGGAHRLFNGLAFHPRELILATLGDNGKSIRIWELDRAELMGTLKSAAVEKLVIPIHVDDKLTLNEKAKAGEYDVFLCHNSLDKDTVMELGRRLKDRNVLPWLDEWEVPPGHSWLRRIGEQIGKIKTAAVFVGKNSLGPWQEREVEGLIQQFVRRKIPIIPVILKDCWDTPELPVFLTDLKWVDFRKATPDPLSELIWGITGEHPLGSLER